MASKAGVNLILPLRTHIANPPPHTNAGMWFSKSNQVWYNPYGVVFTHCGTPVSLTMKLHPSHKINRRTQGTATTPKHRHLSGKSRPAWTSLSVRLVTLCKSTTLPPPLRAESRGSAGVGHGKCRLLASPLLQWQNDQILSSTRPPSEKTNKRPGRHPQAQ